MRLSHTISYNSANTLQDEFKSLIVRIVVTQAPSSKRTSAEFIDLFPDVPEHSWPVVIEFSVNFRCLLINVNELDSKGLAEGSRIDAVIRAMATIRNFDKKDLPGMLKQWAGKSSSTKYCNCVTMEKLAIDQKSLAETLRAMVHQYGIDRVEKTLFEIRKLADGSPRRSNLSSARSNPCGKQNVTQKRNVQNSASVFVSKLEVSAEVKRLLNKLAKRYEKKKFLPTIGELRNFFEIHRIDAPARFSRVTAIPYVFRYLSNLEIHEIQSMLQTNSFSGPTQLGPIAEAIRRSSKHRMNVAPEFDEVDNSVWEDQGAEAGNLSNP